MKIFRTFWGLWSGLWFGIHLIWCVPLTLLFVDILGQKAEKPALWMLYKFVGRIDLWGMLVFCKHIGRENIKANIPYVIVSNHQSQLDILANAISFPHTFKFLGKAEAAKVPLFGSLVSRMCILVDRKDEASRKQTMVNMKQAIAAGLSVLLYAEGTRNRTAEPLKRMYDGAFRLAIATGTPLVVQTLVNSGNLSSPFRSIDVTPGVITCNWDGPIETKGMSESDIPALKEKVASIMLRYLDPNDFPLPFSDK